MFRLALTGLITAGSIAQALAAETESEFMLRWRCEVTAVLEAVHASRIVKDDESNRFVILSSIDRPQDYVQCAFFDRDARIHCEIASGFYEHRAGEPRAHFVAGARLENVRRLGYSDDDSKGNYVRRSPLTGAEDLSDIADLMLRSLYEVFGGERGLRLELTSPYAKKVGALHCTPMS